MPSKSILTKASEIIVKDKKHKCLFNENLMQVKVAYLNYKPLVVD